VTVHHKLRPLEKGSGLFISPETPDEVQLIETINDEIGRVSPYISRGEDGLLERSWRCRSLLQAIYMMLYLQRCALVLIPYCLGAGSLTAANDPRSPAILSRSRLIQQDQPLRIPL